MRTVMVRLDDVDLSDQMAAMREWLDRHGCQPARFVYDQTGNALVVSVVFPDVQEAEAFATQFDGQERGQIIASLGESGPATAEVYSA